MFRRIVSLLIPAIFVAAGMCFVSAPVARAFDADLANPDILDEATA